MRESAHGALPARGGLLHPGGRIGGYQAVVHGLVQGRRENTLHDAHGVRVQSLLDLARLERANVGGVEVSQFGSPEERIQVVAARPLVPLVSSFAHLVTRGVGEPAREVLLDPDTPRIREEDTAVLADQDRGVLFALTRFAVAP